MKPVILTDVDGILVQWASGLPYFAQKHGINTETILKTLVDEKFRGGTEMFGFNERISDMLMCEYNNSEFIKYLAGYADAIDVVNRLKARFDFIAITALGDTNEALMNRCCNLNTLFPGAFKDIMCVNVGESKMPHYIKVKQKYKDRLVCFIDDLASNLEDCHDAMSTLPLIHMIRTESADRKECKCPADVVKNWYDVERLIKNMGIFELDRMFLNRDQVSIENVKYPPANIPSII